MAVLNGVNPCEGAAFPLCCCGHQVCKADKKLVKCPADAHLLNDESGPGVSYSTPAEIGFYHDSALGQSDPDEPQAGGSQRPARAFRLGAEATQYFPGAESQMYAQSDTSRVRSACQDSIGMVEDLHDTTSSSIENKKVDEDMAPEQKHATPASSLLDEYVPVYSERSVEVETALHQEDAVAPGLALDEEQIFMAGPDVNLNALYDALRPDSDGQFKIQMIQRPVYAYADEEYECAACWERDSGYALRRMLVEDDGEEGNGSAGSYYPLQRLMMSG